MKEFKATFEFDNWLVVLPKIVSIGKVQMHPGSRSEKVRSADKKHWYFDLSCHGGLKVQRITDEDPDVLRAARAELIEALDDFYYCVLHGFTPEKRVEINLDSIVEDETNG